jgi:hypothetical protein
MMLWAYKILDAQNVISKIDWLDVSNNILDV